MKTNVHLWQYLAEFFLEWEMFRTKVIQWIKTHILCPVTFLSRKSCCLWANVEKCGRMGQFIDDKMAYTHCSAAYLRLQTHICSSICCTYRRKGKGKAVPLQVWSGQEGSRKLRFPDYMTMAQDGGKVVSLTHRPPLPPGNTPGTHFC